MAQALLKASKEVGLVASAKETKYMSVTSECNAGQYHSTRTTNKFILVINQLDAQILCLLDRATL